MSNKLNKTKEILKESYNPNEIKNKAGILNIKSKEILSHIFSFLFEKIKLDIIKYIQIYKKNLSLKLMTIKNLMKKEKKVKETDIEYLL